MATVQDWVDSIIQDIPEPMDGAVARQVRYALQEFFRLSEAWRHRESILTGGGSSYELHNLPNNTYAIASRYAYFTSDGRPRYPLTSTLLERLDPSDNGNPNLFALDGNTIHLDSNAPSGILDVEVVVQPDRNINDVDDEVCDKWFEYIRHGAVAALLRIPDKIWTNYGSSETHERAFREGIHLAAREVRRDRSRPKRSIQFNSGFRW